VDLLRLDVGSRDADSAVLVQELHVEVGGHTEAAAAPTVVQRLVHIDLGAALVGDDGPTRGDEERLGDRDAVLRDSLDVFVTMMRTPWIAPFSPFRSRSGLA
jgi:hypothetical protein